MSDTTTNNMSDIETLDKEMQELQAAADKAAAELDARLKRIQEIKDEQTRRLNDPAERAKLFKNANEMIEAGIKEYEAKGYTVNVEFDENNLFAKIVFKNGKIFGDTALR
jgi:predicted  nucleic acid-binding Zn-ribbon protein